ncbi:MAG: endonuclease [Chloroflexota bacterium]|nr:MAG: endonuclease [Chloroflexota bacterium]
MARSKFSGTFKIIKLLLPAAANLYAAAMVVYLALRLVFGDGFWWLSLLNTFAHLLFLPLLPLLALAALARARLTALRLLPLAALGGFWIGPYYLPRAEAPASGSTIQVLTFNIWGNNRRLKTVEEWIRHSGADLVLLQEVAPIYNNERLEGLKDLYPYQSVQPDQARWGGNVTLSRYPILDEAYIDLETPEAAMPLRLLLDVNGQIVAVYNVHLAWPVAETRLSLPVDNMYLQVALGFDDSIRNRQIAGLLRHLRAEPYPFIVGGDFNTSDQSDTYRLLAAQLNDAFRAAGRGFGGTWPVSAARGLPAFLPPLIRIDYLWHSDHFRALDARRGPQLGSDHLPVLATLELLPGSSVSSKM